MNSHLSRSSLFRSAVLPLLLGAISLVGCAEADDSEEGANESSESDLLKKSTDAWYYSGPLPRLSNPNVTISIEGHTLRVSGDLAAGATIPTLPHVKQFGQHVEIVYPIATGASGHPNSKQGNYSFWRAIPYRTGVDKSGVGRDGTKVAWGGFPFIAYDGGRAIHGPISSESNNAFNVFYLQRGTVSHGCNRMNGEHVTEVAHMLGVNMRKVYNPYQEVTAPKAPVRVLSGYDQLNGSYVDVDYPTDTGMKRPSVAMKGAPVVMFGSWVASEMPNGQDLPLSKAWEGGVSGQRYVFAKHVQRNWVCSAPAGAVTKLKDFATAMGGELPKNFCEKSDCILSALDAGKNAKTACGL